MFALRRVASRAVTFTPRFLAARSTGFLAEHQSNLLKVVESEIKEAAATKYPSEDLSAVVADLKDWKFNRDGADLSAVKTVGKYHIKVEWQSMNAAALAEEGSVGVPFDITVSQEGKGGLFFQCDSLSPSEENTGEEAEAATMMIHNVRTFAAGQDPKSEDLYEGPLFMDLAEGFQESLDVWLTDLLGNTNDLVDLITISAEDVEQAQYAQWLNDIKSFIQ